MTDFDLLTEINGADDEGNSKVSCTLAFINILPSGEVITLNTVTTIYGYIYSDIKTTKILSSGHGNISTIKLIFDSVDDADFNSFVELCDKKFNMCGNIDDVNNGTPMLVLYISPLSDFTKQMMVLDCSYSVIPMKDNLLCCIQFIVNSDNIVFNEVSEEDMDEIINSTANELEQLNDNNTYEEDYDDEDNSETIHRFY